MKSQRTKALEIPIKVKQAVAERDSFNDHPCCIWCGKPAPLSDTLAFSNAHYIPRSDGGLGIEENILTLCPMCHELFDTSNRANMKVFFEQHLKGRYSDWDEEKLRYKKEQV